jgi:RHS repeat-associated protein
LHNVQTDSRGINEGGTPPLLEERITAYNSILEFSDRMTAGWTSAMQPPAILGSVEIDIYDADGGSYEPNASPEPTPLPEVPHWIKRVQILLPDGSSHELRASDSPVNCQITPAECYTLTNGTYLAVDGSRLKLVVGEAQPVGGTRTVLYTSDGGRYFFPVSGTIGANGIAALHTFAEYFIDRHGNKTVFNYNGSNRTWTDTLGRSFTDPLPNSILGQFPSVGTQNFELPGINNQTRGYSFKWEKLKADGCTTGGEAACMDSALENPADELYYAGSDACSSAFNDNPVSPHLFAATIFSNDGIIVEGDRRVRLLSKDRTCALMPPAIPTNNPPPPVTRHNPLVLAEINLPDGTKYEFKYNRYGEMTKIIYPTGGYERFRYDAVIAVGTGASNPTNRGVVERWVSFDGITETQHWQYQTQGLTINNRGWVETTTTAPDGSQTKRLLRTEQSQPLFGFSDPYAGMPVDERSYSKPDATSGQRTILSRKLTEWTTTGPLPGGHPSAKRNARVRREISIIFEPTATSALVSLGETEYGDELTYAATPDYFADLNVTKTKTYHYKAVSRSTAETADIEYFKALFTSADVARVGVTEYLYDANYKNRNINPLVSATRIEDATGTVFAKSEMRYDESGYPLLSVAGTVPSWQNPNTNLRGLITTSRVWNSANNTWIETHGQYDLLGNLRKSTDGRGNVSEIKYEDSFSDSVSRNSYAFPTQAISAAPDPTGQRGSATPFVTATKYDFSTGLPVSITDANGSTEYNDVLLRPTKVVPPAGGGEVVTEYGIGTTPQTRFVKVRKQIDAQNWDESISWYDALGRTVKSQSKDAQGDVFVETEYDEMSRVKRVTNPYRTGDTKLWTTSEYDLSSRVKKVITPDTAKIETVYDLSTTGGLLGTTKTVIDQAGKKRKGIADALGRMRRVVEDPDGLNLATDYIFDVLGNIRQTVQGGQSRFFAYDSLGRVIRARQPEQGINAALNLNDQVTGNSQWSVSYSYDANGNTVATTDARGITVSGTYDALNRLVLRDYSDTATPDVSFTFDNPAVQFSKGKLTEVASSVSTTKYTEFDRIGGVLKHQQTTGGQTYNFAYQYNLAGALTSQTYPSGRTVRNVFDANGDLAAVSSRANQTAPVRAFADSFAYTAVGAVAAMRLGNGRWETAQFNNRLQVTQIALGTSAADTSLLKLDYSYGTAAQNNGAMREQKISYAGLAQPIVQSYGYDSLNRLQSSAERVQGASTDSWKQTFTIDRFGNRRFDAANTTLPSVSPSVEKVANPQIDAATNRFLEHQDADGVKDYEYDPAGNLTKDAEGKLFAYDAENRQKSFGTGGSHTNGASYYYDGQGKRVKKTISLGGGGQRETIFVYDAFSKLAAEYENMAPAANGTTKFLTSDHLGSPRVVTDSAGAVVSRHDYQAYGEEVYAGYSNRTEAHKYNTEDGVRQQFTGYERDDESGLDFAQARYYQSRHGRFTSVDPLTASATIRNPQTFNRYSYALNSPYKFTDQLGLIAVPVIRNNTLQCRIFGCNEAEIPDGEGETTSEEEQQQQEDTGPVRPSEVLGTVVIHETSDEWYVGTLDDGRSIRYNIPDSIIQDLNAEATKYYRLKYAQRVNAANALKYANAAADLLDSKNCGLFGGCLKRDFVSAAGEIIIPTEITAGSEQGVSNGVTSSTSTQSKTNGGLASTYGDAANKQLMEINKMHTTGLGNFIEKHRKTSVSFYLIGDSKGRGTGSFTKETLTNFYNNALARGGAKAVLRQ